MDSLVIKINVKGCFVTFNRHFIYLGTNYIVSGISLLMITVHHITFITLTYIIIPPNYFHLNTTYLLQFISSYYTKSHQCSFVSRMYHLVGGCIYIFHCSHIILVIYNGPGLTDLIRLYYISSPLGDYTTCIRHQCISGLLASRTYTFIHVFDVDVFLRRLVWFRFIIIIYHIDIDLKAWPLYLRTSDTFILYILQLIETDTNIFYGRHASFLAPFGVTLMLNVQHYF